MPTLEYTVKLDMITEECVACGIGFGMPASLVKQRKEDHKSFYCPNGHGQHFLQESEADRLRREVNAARTQAAFFKDESARRAAELTAKENDIKRLHRRVKAGVCPLCHRTFKQLAQHMNCKHPEAKPSV